MLIPLSEAPMGVELEINHISGSEFANRLSRLGLYQGAVIRRLPQETAIGPAKIRAKGKDITLSGWFAGHIVMHRDDDCRLPLLECRSGESGHVEGLSGQTFVEESLLALGISEGDEITYLRRVPPMLYHATLQGKPAVSINEVLASHILGETADGLVQFSAVGTGEVLTVTKVLPGEDADVFLAGLGVIPGVDLVLSKVSARQNISVDHSAAIACMTAADLSLYFHERDAGCIFVKVKG